MDSKNGTTAPGTIGRPTSESSLYPYQVQYSEFRVLSTVVLGVPGTVAELSHGAPISKLPTVHVYHYVN